MKNGIHVLQFSFPLYFFFNSLVFIWPSPVFLPLFASGRKGEGAVNLIMLPYFGSFHKYKRIDVEFWFRANRNHVAI
jgi:hypothetical protein